MPTLDTSALLDLMGKSGNRRRLAIADLVNHFLAQGKNVSTTRICVAELRVGIHRAKDPQAEAKVVDALLKKLRIIELTPSAAELFAVFKARLMRLGRPIGNLDLLIAAMTSDDGGFIVTNNANHFGMISELKVIEY